MAKRNDTESYFYYLDLLKEVQSLIAELSCQSRSNPSYKHIWQVYQKTLEFERKQREGSTMLYDSLPQIVTELHDPAGHSQTLLNDKDGILMAEKASNAYESIAKLINQARQLAVRGASDTSTTADRVNIGNEVRAIKLEIDRISATTDYNGLKIVKGMGTKTIQVGPNNTANDKIDVKFEKIDAAGIKADNNAQAEFQTLMTSCDTAIAACETEQTDASITINRLQTAQKKSKEDINSVAQSLESSLRDVASYYRQMAQFYFATCPKKDIPSNL